MLSFTRRFVMVCKPPPILQDGLVGGHLVMLGPGNDAAATAALKVSLGAVMEY